MERDGYSAPWDRSADYMLGTVAVAVIALESDGSIDPSAEDWTTEELDKVQQEVTEGLNFWEGKAQERGVELDFVFVEGYPIVVFTGYEPISRPGGFPDWGSEEFLWIDAAMADLGYNNYPVNEYLLEVRGYNHNLRQANHADWAFTVFVVDSSHDFDPQTGDPTPGGFSNGVSAYAWVTGPHTVVTRDNNGWEFDNLGDVLAHEIGHVFGAPDEEPADWSCKDNSSCEWLFGYLNECNQNCNQSSCERPDDDCIMRAPRFNEAGNYNTICEYTEAHVGWRDSDFEGLPDPVDTVPQLTITGYPSSPSSSRTLEYAAEIVDIPWPTTHPEYIPVSINTVSVQYQIGSTSGSWATAIPGDGDWDSSYEEDFKIWIPDNGTYTIYFRAINEVGHVSSITSHTVTINSSEPVYRNFLSLVLLDY